MINPAFRALEKDVRAINAKLDRRHRQSREIILPQQPTNAQQKTYEARQGEEARQQVNYETFGHLAPEQCRRANLDYAEIQRGKPPEPPEPAIDIDAIADAEAKERQRQAAGDHKSEEYKKSVVQKVE